MKHLHAALLTLVLLATSACSAGCPRPNPDAPTGLIDCAAQAVRDRAIGLIPIVNSTLLEDDWKRGLIGLIDPVAGITEQVLACVVNLSGARAAAAYQANASDAVSLKVSTRAQVFINERGYRFAEQDGSP